jgi:hypothetical protein
MVQAEQDPGGEVVFSPNIVFCYQVGGRTYTGTRYRFVSVATPNRERIGRIIAGLPLGSGVVVHYRADDPSEAVIDTSFNEDDALLIEWFTMISLTTLVLYVTSYGAGSLIRPTTPAFARSVKRGANGFRIRLPGSPGGTMVALAVWVAAVLATLLCSILVQEDLLTSAGSLLAIYAGATLFAGFAGAVVIFARKTGGRDDIHVDLSHRTLALPRFGCSHPWLTIPLADIADIRVVRQSRDWYGLRLDYGPAENPDAQRQTEFCWSPGPQFSHDFADRLRTVSKAEPDPAGLPDIFEVNHDRQSTTA